MVTSFQRVQYRGAEEGGGGGSMLITMDRSDKGAATWWSGSASLVISYIDSIACSLEKMWSKLLPQTHHPILAMMKTSDTLKAKNGLQNS